jgi:hypothetical protein
VAGRAGQRNNLRGYYGGTYNRSRTRERPDEPAETGADDLARGRGGVIREKKKAPARNDLLSRVV